MKRILFLLLGILCLVCIVCCVWCSVSISFAEEHYQNHYDEVKNSLLASLGNKRGYGCGDDACSYCNGGKGKDSISDFAYYRTFSAGKTVSIVGAILFGAATVAVGAYEFSKKNI